MKHSISGIVLCFNFDTGQIAVMQHNGSYWIVPGTAA
jgi:hypothetical protein